PALGACISVAPFAWPCWPAWEACRARWPLGLSWVSRRASCSLRSAHPGRPPSRSGFCCWSWPCARLVCSAADCVIREWNWFIAGALAVMTAALILTHALQNEYFFFAGYVVMQFVVLATAWNILGGYAGYVNFGSGAFFAVGAYTAVALIKAIDAPLIVQLIAALTLTGLLGFGVGALTLRLRGIFFSIATVAVAVIWETAVVNWRFVGGARGLAILQPAAPLWFESYTRFLFVAMALIAVLSVALARYIQISWIGRGLRAIRDDEDAA